MDTESLIHLDAGWEQRERASPGASQCRELIRGKIALIVFTFVFIQNVPLSPLSPLSVSLLSALDPSLARGVWPQPLSSFGSFGPIVPSRQLRFVQGPNHFHLHLPTKIMQIQKLSTYSWRSLTTFFQSKCCLHNAWPWQYLVYPVTVSWHTSFQCRV